MKTIAFIFARGGSKGLPNKNIKLLGGIPLIGHSILSAKENNSISAIYVSTDSQKIKDVAIELGANIIDRPDNLATDNSPEWFSWRHAVEELGDKGIKFDCFVSLPATAPLRSDDDINQCILALKEGVDMVITASHASRNPSFNMIHRDKDGLSKLIMNSDFYRRQDAPQAFDLTTVAYVTRPEYILNKKNIFEGNTYSVIIPKERAIDIDDKIDFFIAEKLYEKNTRS